MFCTPITFLQYIKNTKQLFHWRGKTTFLSYILKNSVKKHLGCIAYILNRGIDASKANLLKKELLKKTNTGTKV